MAKHFNHLSTFFRSDGREGSRQPITAKHKLFLPKCEANREPCGISHSDTGYICSRSANHKGDHAAHGTSPSQYLRWPQKESK